MALGIILTIGGIILFLLPTGWSAVLGIILFLFGIYRTLKGLKKFLFELIDHAKGTAPRSDVGKKDYTAEAQRAYEEVTPKRKRDEKPPWEE